jgi:hypothetical protein
MNISDILNAMDRDSSNEKTAQVTNENAKGALISALEKIQTSETVKTAAPNTADPIEALFKVANELAGAEKEAEAAQAYICGAAFADGAIAKFAAYDAIVKEEAANQAIALMQQEKTASDTQELEKVAMEQGYADAIALMQQEKTASEGYNQALLEVKDTAMREFIKGAAVAEHMIAKYARQ